MAGDAHSRRLDRIEAELPPIRPSLEELGQEYDRLIDAYTRHQAGEPGVSLASLWPVDQMDRWATEMIEEGCE